MRCPDPMVYYIFYYDIIMNTYGHRSQRTEDPVRSPVLKLRTGRLVLRWVTTWEYRLPYVLPFYHNHGSENPECFLL